jgi:hypothetical protein
MTKPGLDPIESKRAFTVTHERKGVLPITEGKVSAVDLYEFARAALAADAVDVVFNHDQLDKLVGCQFSAEVAEA